MMSRELSFQLDTQSQSAALRELQTCPHWVCYRKEVRHGRLTKVPYSPLNGRCAQSNDPATWSDYQTAEQAVKRYRCDGLGYMFHQDFTGVDLDHCVDAEGVIETLKQERSGILAWARTRLPRLATFCIPSVLKKATRDYQDEENEVTRFIEDNCYREPDATVSATVLYLYYKQWHKDTQHGHCMTSVVFGREIAKLSSSEKYLKYIRKHLWDQR